MNAKSIQQAVDLLRGGEVVAFPTETVYGLGADATNADAVARIFIAKGRPATNPLIVHVADARAARRWAAVWPAEAERLTAALWPGPLTLVLPKSPMIVDAVTSGRGTVGLRVPRHPLALELLKAFGGPVAAPSANRSNHISPTTAQHVRDELGDAAPLVLDGGPCQVGIESTVLDLCGAEPAILRPGSISPLTIRLLLGRPVRVAVSSVDPTVAATSPGQQATHYAPTTPAYHFSPPAIPPAEVDAAYLLLLNADPQRFGVIVRMPGHPVRYAQELYRAMRELDSRRLSRIYVELPPPEPQWLAVRDRLLRASQDLSGTTDARR